VATLKLALFDLDGTLTKEKSSWEFIHRHLGVWKGNADKFQEAFLKGEISYERFCQLDAAIWKGMKAAELERILAKIPLHAGIKELVAHLRSRGMKLVILSTGLSLLSDRVANQYGFDYAVANDLGVVDGKLNGKIKINVHFDQKKTWVQKIMRRFKVHSEEVLAVGDSAGDLGMFEIAGFSVAYNSACDPLKKIATFCLHSSDLRDLIPALAPYLDDQATLHRKQIPAAKPLGSRRPRLPGKFVRVRKHRDRGQIYECPQCQACNFAPRGRLKMALKTPLSCWKCGAEMDKKKGRKQELNRRTRAKRKEPLE
jgi:phosphoserine phosphatase